MIEAFSPKDTRARMADWVELRLLFYTATRISDAEVLNVAARLDDPEHGSWTDQDDPDAEAADEEILQPHTERRREDIWLELEHRQNVLGAAYPFVLKPTPTGGWRLERRSTGTDQESIARDVYVAMLIMSAFRHHHIGKAAADEATFKDLVARISKLFQTVAVLAAANLLDHVYWFGWPRLDQSGFLDAVADVRRLIGRGQLRQPPSATAVNMKDGTIDLIAWRSFRDGMYGSLLLYGQVASGANWLDKPLKSYLNGKFLDHFVDWPAAQHLVSMFIPFVAHDDVDLRSSDDRARTLLDYSRSREHDFGLVVDRLRIVELLAEGVKPVDKMHNSPDPASALAQISTWIEDCRAYAAPTSAQA